MYDLNISRLYIVRDNLRVIGVALCRIGLSWRSLLSPPSRYSDPPLCRCPYVQFYAVWEVYLRHTYIPQTAFKQIAVQAFLLHRSRTLSAWWTLPDYQHSPWQLLGMYKSGRCHSMSLYSYHLNHSVYTVLVHEQTYYFHVYLSLSLSHSSSSVSSF